MRQPANQTHDLAPAYPSSSFPPSSSSFPSSPLVRLYPIPLPPRLSPHPYSYPYNTSTPKPDSSYLYLISILTSWLLPPDTVSWSIYISGAEWGAQMVVSSISMLAPQVFVELPKWKN